MPRICVQLLACMVSLTHFLVLVCWPCLGYDNSFRAQLCTIILTEVNYERLAMIKIVLGVQTRCLFRTKSEIFGVRFIYYF